MKARIQVYFARHAQTLLYALGQLLKAPLATSMTAAVLGIALALPVGLHVLLQNVQQVSSGWDGAAQISLFVKREVSAEHVARLAKSLLSDSDVAEVETISPESALAEFRERSGFGAALEALDENPLPAVLIVRPTPGAARPARVEDLLNRLWSLPEVELAQLDLQWVKRLYTILEIGQRGVWLLGALFGLSVLLVIGNTIRLAIENRREEIEIIKLIGGTDAFIRRPFLYSGIWYGLGGGIIAWLLITGCLWLLQDPVARLSILYSSEYRLGSLDFATSASLLGLGALFGWAGSWLAVGRHLGKIEPA